MARQINQKIWLQKQVDINEEQRAKIIKLCNNMDVMLEVVFYHTMTDAACRYLCLSLQFGHITLTVYFIV